MVCIWKSLRDKTKNADYSSTFNDPSSNPATAIPPSADSAQDRAQGVSGTSNEFIKMVPDDVFQTYNYYYIINWWDFTAFLDYMYIYCSGCSSWSSAVSAHVQVNVAASIQIIKYYGIYLLG